MYQSLGFVDSTAGSTSRGAARLPRTHPAAREAFKQQQQTLARLARQRTEAGGEPPKSASSLAPGLMPQTANAAAAAAAAQEDDEVAVPIKRGDAPPPVQAPQSAAAVPLVVPGVVPHSVTKPAATSAAARLSQAAIAERRYAFLEMAEKSNKAELSVLRGLTQSMRARIEELEAQSHATPPPPFLVRGTIARETTASENEPGTEPGTEPAASAPVYPVMPGARVTLAYPMKEHDGFVSMRRLRVHPTTAELSWDWLRIWKMDEASARVGNFE